MKKKLNLVLRDPVKLHKTNQNIPELPSPFEKREAQIEPRKSDETEDIKKVEKAAVAKEKTVETKPKTDKKPRISQTIEIADVRKEMSLRIKQTWEYFCSKANADNELRNSFTVTRAEVMREAGIGSTNTYRDALKKMQSLGLIRIELRPGVNTGSVFYLTDEGLEQAKLVLTENL
ncbi:MAG TPA: hypothetical protein PKY59_19675 [Pyrinomonadaceae bacterium]|nr:hypothetical protein [Pyrinomonadaceae bacterium]